MRPQPSLPTFHSLSGKRPESHKQRIVNAKGIQPLRVEPLPRKVLLECILPEWLRMERDLEAYKTGDRSMLLYGVLERHQTRSYDQAVAVLEELLGMDDHEEIAAHYQWPPKW